ncbi:MAG: prepilin-type N-terminal cleavage/methylation domain-containing protein [Candidatus Omnitrophota bacterium]
MKKNGLTILEIIVVIVVIGIVTAIAIPRIKGMQASAHIEKVRRDLKTIQSAIEAYRTFHHNALPANITTALTNSVPQILPSTLPDPFAANGTDTYQYEKTSDDKYYALYSLGPDKAVATAAILTTGAVPTSGDDILITNGAASALDTATDTANCGTIGTSCGQAQSCAGGVCLSPAPGSIADHNACDTNADCASGACAGSPKACLPAGETVNGDPCTLNTDCLSGACCGGICTNTSSNANNCATCGNACNLGPCCNAICVGTSNKNNCGGCGIICPGNQICEYATCHAPCSSGEVYSSLSYTCVNLNLDPQNCGTLGFTCGNNQICANGICLGYPGALCANNEECITTYCDGNICTDGSDLSGCANNASCVHGFCASMHVCTNRSNGNPCGVNADCVSNTCSGGTCS